MAERTGRNEKQDRRSQLNGQVEVTERKFTNDNYI